MTSKQSKAVSGVPVDARYTYFPTFRFFTYANLVARLCHEETAAPMVLTFVMAGYAATVAIGSVGKHGNAHVGWMPICNHLGKFCDRITISIIIISYLSFLLVMILTIEQQTNGKIFFRL
ncbi:hypothetical protein BT93_A0608 [Corymbia citriodora subsp. variegata]|nr:hypothetical protein BT93_A0608 [Corymbia citriodora subsp. variegata]